MKIRSLPLLISYSFCLCFVFLSCENETNKSYNYELLDLETPSEFVSIELPNNVNILGYPIGYSTQYSDGLQTKLKMIGKNIYELDLENKVFSLIDSISSEGPRSLPGKNIYADGFFSVFNNSSNTRNIYYMSNNEERLYKIDQKTSQSIFGKELDDDFSFIMTTVKPQLFNNNLFFALTNSSHFKEKKPFSFLKYSLDQTNTEFVIPFLEDYNHNYYGEPYLYIPSLTFSSGNNQYYVSFPIANDIYVYDSNFNFISKKYFGSEVVGEVEPLDESLAPEKQRELFKHLNYYTNLYFDETSQVYIREYRGYVNQESRYQYLLANKEFTKFKDLQIPAKYNMFNSFILKGKIYLFNQMKYDEQTEEKYIYFDIFDLKGFFD